ncbi:MAG: alpha/beta hydrolase [Bacteroidia bacterium]
MSAVPHTFTLPHGDVQLQGYTWEPEHAPLAVLLIVHGHGEHAARYAHVAQYLNQHGIAVMAYDQYGHGRSQGKKGHFPTYDYILDGIELFRYEAARVFPEIPLFLMGHSMGGNLVATYALQLEPALQGVILSAPWLRLAFKPSGLDLFLAKAMVNIYPSYTQSSKLDVTAISRDPAEVDKYRQDPLIHDKVSPSLFLGVVEHGEWALEHAPDFSLPLLVMHGTGDRITDWAASEQFAARAGSDDVTFRQWEGYFHEMHNEAPVHRAPILDTYRRWILDRLVPPQA